MTTEAWVFLGTLVVTVGAMFGSWMTSKSGKPANDAAEERISQAEVIGQPAEGWMSLTGQWRVLVTQMRDELAEVKAEQTRLRAEFDTLRGDFDLMAAYVRRLIDAWGSPSVPEPPERVRRHLRDIFTRDRGQENN